MTHEHYPPEYETGEVEFFSRKFRVTPDVLIPRLETETLVRQAIGLCKGNTIDTVIDIGTGSGIIPVSLWGRISETVRLYAVDCSETALAVARENAKRHSVTVNLFTSDLLETFFSWKWYIEHLGRHLLLIANLPYVRDGDLTNMSPDTVYEPALALFGGPETGFEIYERLFDMIPDFVARYRPESLRILCEIGYDQSDIAQASASRHGWTYDFFLDPAGIARVFFLTIPCSSH